MLVFAPVAPAFVDELQREFGDELRVIVVVEREIGDEPAGWRVVEDAEGLARQRYDAAAGTAYLVRPDQLVAARWRTPKTADVREALVRAQGGSALK